MRITDKYVFFFTKEDFFSNHYHCRMPFSRSIGEPLFYTVEHYMMYYKAVLFGDMDIATEILSARTPQQAKLLGRKVKGFDPVQWDLYKVDIVSQGIYSKIMENPEIKTAAYSLHAKGLTFVEASPYDAIWGIKMGENYLGVEDPKNWRGLNLLGKAWHKAIAMAQVADGGWE